MVRFSVVAVVLVFVVGVLVENVECGRTIKKYSAYSKPVFDEVTSEEEETTHEEQQQSVEPPVRETLPAVQDNLKCSEDGHCKRKKKIVSSATTAVVTSPAVTATSQKQQHHQHLPPTMYELNWRNRLRNSNPVQMSSQRFLAQLQRASLDMARGILSGLGWDIQGWEMILLESIVKTISKDLVFMMQLFF